MQAFAAHTPFIYFYLLFSFFTVPQKETSGSQLGAINLSLKKVMRYISGGHRMNNKKSTLQIQEICFVAVLKYFLFICVKLSSLKTQLVSVITHCFAVKVGNCCKPHMYRWFISVLNPLRCNSKVLSYITLLTGASCVRTDPAWSRVLSPNLPGDLSLRLSSTLPGDFSLSSGRAGDLSRLNSVRPSR